MTRRTLALVISVLSISTLIVGLLHWEFPTWNGGEIQLRRRANLSTVTNEGFRLTILKTTWENGVLHVKYGVDENDTRSSSMGWSMARVLFYDHDTFLREDLVTAAVRSEQFLYIVSSPTTMTFAVRPPRKATHLSIASGPLETKRIRLPTNSE